LHQDDGRNRQIPNFRKWGLTYHLSQEKPPKKWSSEPPQTGIGAWFPILVDRQAFGGPDAPFSDAFGKALYGKREKKITIKRDVIKIKMRFR